jgi:hypothetical protein
MPTMSRTQVNRLRRLYVLVRRFPRLRWASVPYTELADHAVRLGMFIDSMPLQEIMVVSSTCGKQNDSVFVAHGTVTYSYREISREEWDAELNFDGMDLDPRI